MPFNLFEEVPAHAPRPKTATADENVTEEDTVDALALTVAALQRQHERNAGKIPILHETVQLSQKDGVKTAIFPEIGALNADKITRAPTMYAHDDPDEDKE